MGAEQSKNPQPRKMEMNDVIFQLKMSSKRFDRERKRAEKEKDKNTKKAIACLKKGDEEGARLFAVNAQKNINDRLKYLQMSSRLESMAATLKANHASNEIMAHLSNNVTPILMQQSQEIPLNQLVKNFENFQESYDNMLVTTNIMEGNFDKMQMGNNQAKNADDLFNQLKVAAGYEIGKEMGIEQVDTNQNTNTQKQTNNEQENPALDDYIQNLRNL